MRLDVDDAESDSSSRMLGEGNSISFWSDTWRGEEVPFPTVYGLALLKEGPVAEFWDGQGWKITYGRNAYGWEVENFLIFFLLQFVSVLR